MKASLVILQSLKQSREKWLRSTFPKFSTRSRGGKQPDVVPPPHTMYNRGRCTLEIGPHVFTDTTVFEVHYHPVAVPVTPPTTFVYQSVPSGSWQLNPQSSQANETTSTALPTSTPLLASLPSTLHVTQTLVSQVNQAAASNPTLANLLQLAVAGKASPDQLKTLGLLIQSLASSPSATVDSTQPSTDPAPSKAHADSGTPTLPTTSQYQLQTPTRDFDLVLEFRENPADRWTFPRGPSKCEFVTLPGISGAFGDIILTTAIPFTALNATQGVEGVSETQTIPKQVVAFRFKSAGSAVWDTISRWVGPNIEENCKILSSIKPQERKFLAHRLPEGPELSQIQNAAIPSYSMKPIKPATENNKSRRKTVRRSVADGHAQGSPTAKRKRPTQNKNQMEPPRIACHSCGQSEVPLIQGGRYCRPCINDGRVSKPGEPAITSDLPAARKADQHLLQPTSQPATAATMVPPAGNNENSIDDPNT
ncbi:hypothetical protein EDD16DRAFT_1169420 [Pisolithus croceorrhizus]|nr:hypothetical protein EDD16DRAFT_1169420 [Pisolithus croceorrhizus]KAI6114946.1 hypothetical protein EV401DRAFT_122312 [Pisolithus croceorrhizus]KAI6163815.1 hypothetical protein EDD17DRAFT_437608 [Pisolithus thermaeus]